MLKEKELELLETLKLANDMNLKKIRDLQSNQIHGEVEGKEIKIKDASGGHCELDIAGDMKQAVRQGYNKLVYPYIDTTKTTNGINFIDLFDGRVMANGEATADAYFNLSRSKIKAGTYLYTTGVSGSTSSYFCKFGTTNIISKSNLTFSEEFTPTESYICIKKGTKVSNLIFEPMLIEGNAEKEFEQYGVMPSLDYPSKIVGTEAYNKFYVVNSKTEEAGIKVNKINLSSLIFNGTTNGIFYYELMNFNSLVLRKKMYFKKFGNFSGGKVLISYIKNGETSISYHNLDWENNKDKSFEVGTTLIALYIQQPESNIKIEGNLEILYTEYENKDKEFLPYNVVQTEIRNKNHFDIGSNNNEWSSFSDNGSKLTNLFGIPSTVDMTILNDKVSIDRYDTKNYMWIGKRIFIEKNTDYIITRKHSLPMEIRGFYTLNINSAGTKITVSNQEFNSGDFPYYFVVFYPKESGEYIEDFQIIEKSADLNYIKHQNQKYQLSLGDRILYGDDNSRDNFVAYIDEDLYNKTGYKKIDELRIVRNWHKYTVTGNENFVFQINNRFQLSTDAAGIPKCFNSKTASTVSDIYCNMATKATPNQTYDNTIIDCISCSITGSFIYISLAGYSDLQLFKQKLQELNTAGNPLYIIYRLLTPTEELITDSLLISQIEEMINNIEVYDEETNISSDCYLKLKYCKSLQKYIENKIKEVSLNE